jgi:transcription elongation factor GreA
LWLVIRVRLLNKTTAPDGDGQRNTPAYTDALDDNYGSGDEVGPAGHPTSVADARPLVNHWPLVHWPLVNHWPAGTATLDPIMAPTTRLTQETFDRLQAELDDLRTRGRIEIAKAIEAARALGDLSENGDYHAAKDSQGKMEARIRQLEATLEDARVVDGSIGEDGVVDVGVLVSLRYVGDEEVEKFLIGSIEERREGAAVISPDSQLGQALKGRRQGEMVAYETPTGARLEVEIVKVGD